MNKREHEHNKMNYYRKDMVHFVLLHSYLVFLLAIVLGVLFDVFTKVKIFSNNIYQTIGLLMLVIGSMVIYWAQNTSSNYKKKIGDNSPKSFFELGPYKYLRSPTHFGLFILTLGFGLIINSFFSIIFTIIAYLITKISFLKKEEKILEKKYGQVYTDYKKKVRNWI